LPPLLAVASVVGLVVTVVLVLVLVVVLVAIPRHGEFRQLSQSAHRTSSHRRLGVTDQWEELVKVNREQCAVATATIITTTFTIPPFTCLTTFFTITFTDAMSIAMSIPYESLNQGEDQQQPPTTTVATVANGFVFAHQ
jgi:hypothetical protein